MKLLYTDEFRKQFHRLPIEIQRIYYTQEDRLRLNPFDPRLHGKPLKGQEGVFSFRITRRYRVLFMFSEETIIICLSVSHRKDVYR